MQVLSHPFRGLVSGACAFESPREIVFVQRNVALRQSTQKYLQLRRGHLINGFD